MMEGEPRPLTAAHILSVLQYICPPSSLQHIPAHILSLPLLQRHHFLNITPDDPAAYLTWPSHHSGTVLALLESVKLDDLFDFLQPSDANLARSDIRYVADPEAVYAHFRIIPTSVPLSSHPNIETPLCVIFLWDQNSDIWKYHNSAIGSFPDNSHSTLSHAMALFQSPDDFLPEHTYAFSIDNLDEEDAYWNTYGVGDNALTSHRPLKPVSSTDAEEAYWSQYSSIQGQGDLPAPLDSSDRLSPIGSADSTIPSPRPLNRHLDQSQNAEADQRVFITSSEFNPDPSQSEIYNPLVPPSPSSLSRRLAALPTRPDSPPLQEDDPPSTSVSEASPSPQSPQSNIPEETFTMLSSAAGPTADADSAGNITANEALKSTIRGLYHLWDPSTTSKESFLALVREAIEE